MSADRKVKLVGGQTLQQRYGTRDKPETRRAWRAKNRRSVCLHTRQYKLRHPDRIAKERASRSNTERERLRQRAWAKKHRPDIKRRALELGVAVGRIDYGRVLSKAMGLCGICRGPLGDSKVHYDHIVPLTKGGAHSEDNMQAAHARCNLRKGNRQAA